MGYLDDERRSQFIDQIMGNRYRNLRDMYKQEVSGYWDSTLADERRSMVHGNNVVRRVMEGISFGDPRSYCPLCAERLTQQLPYIDTDSRSYVEGIIHTLRSYV
jgi:hypothetical protein